MFTTETRSGLDTWLQHFAHIQVDPEDEHGPMGENHDGVYQDYIFDRGSVKLVRDQKEIDTYYKLSSRTPALSLASPSIEVHLATVALDLVPLSIP